MSPLPKNRSPLSSNGGGAFARWSVAGGANGGVGSRPCQTYENLDFLYRNPPANSAPSGASAPPPPLPAKCIQRGEILWCGRLACIIKNTSLSSQKTQYLWFRSSPACMKDKVIFFPSLQVALTLRFRSQHRRATLFHDAALTRPHTPPVPRHVPDIALLQPSQKTKARWENHQGLHMDKEVFSGDRSRAGRASLVLALALKAVSRQHPLRTT